MTVPQQSKMTDAEMVVGLLVSHVCIPSLMPAVNKFGDHGNSRFGSCLVESGLVIPHHQKQSITRKIMTRREDTMHP
jgi:hypothetical protein